MERNLDLNHTRDFKIERARSARSMDLKSQVWFQTKIEWDEVQLPLYYTHFEIA